MSTPITRYAPETDSQSAFNIGSEYNSGVMLPSLNCLTLDAHKRVNLSIGQIVPAIEATNIIGHLKPFQDPDTLIQKTHTTFDNKIEGLAQDLWEIKANSKEKDLCSRVDIEIESVGTFTIWVSLGNEENIQVLTRGKIPHNAKKTFSSDTFKVGLKFSNLFEISFSEKNNTHFMLDLESAGRSVFRGLNEFDFSEESVFRSLDTPVFNKYSEMQRADIANQIKIAISNTNPSETLEVYIKNQIKEFIMNSVLQPDNNSTPSTEYSKKRRGT